MTCPVLNYNSAELKISKLSINGCLDLDLECAYVSILRSMSERKNEPVFIIQVVNFHFTLLYCQIAEEMHKNQFVVKPLSKKF